MLLLAILLVGALADDCQKLDFVNSNASPTIESAAFTRVAEFADDELAAGRLQFTIRLPKYAALTGISFEKDDAAEDSIDGTGTALDNAVIGFDPEAALTPDGECDNIWTSSELEWSTVKEHLTLKESASPATYGNLHYRAEIVVATSNPYDPETLYSDGAAALSTDDSRTRLVTTSFQLYFTLPEFVEARVTITAAALPTPGVTEKIQLQDVVTKLARDTLFYTTTMTLESTINWPYILENASATSTIATTATNTEVAGYSALGRSDECNRLGNEDIEEVCKQHWTVVLTYDSESLCGDAIDGIVTLDWNFRNDLPNDNGATDAEKNKGPVTYNIEITTDAIQCAVDAGDIDVFGNLEQTGGENEIGKDAMFTLTIRDTALPGVTISDLRLNEVGTTQDYGTEARKVHFEDYEGVTVLEGADFHGDDNSPAVTNTKPTDEMSPEARFTLNLHQTLFNLDAFLDGSTQQLLVDATAQISYTKDRRRRRRLMSFGGIKHGKTMATKIVSVTKPEVFCADFDEKDLCKKADTDEGSCRWNKKSCHPKKKPSTCTKLGARQCKRSKNCEYKQKTKSCRSTKKVKCSTIADTQELCEETPGCMVLLKGTEFQGCRGTVKLG